MMTPAAAQQTHNNNTSGVVGGGGGVGNGSVIMIYGLPTNRFNCDHLFNLVCSYGNVLKVYNNVVLGILD